MRSSLEIPVTFSTSSAVHFAASSRILSIPKTLSSMYFVSSKPSSKMIFNIPYMKAISVPGRILA